MGMYKSTDDFKFTAFYENHYHELMLLVFLARADGVMRKNEMELIAEYVRAAGFAGSAEFVQEKIKSWKCVFEQFGKSLKTTKELPADVKTTLGDFAEKIYALKTNPDAMETAALQKIKAAAL